MKIALVGSINRPVQPAGIGGIGVFNYLLSKGLTMQKSEDTITLFASGDSQADASLYPVVAQALAEDTQSVHDLKHTIKDVENAALISALRYIKQEGYTVIHHNHYNFVAVALSVLLGLRTIVTLHVGRDISFVDDLKQSLGPDFEKIIFVALSQAQLRDNPDINFKTVIPNGIDTNQFPYRPTSEAYVAWLGRIVPEKGLDQAMKLADELGLPLHYAGPIIDQSYFDKLKQRYPHPDFQYLGVVNESQRANLLSGARALLFPINWKEPFGLVMIEAMACGTPVVAYDQGAVSEIIKQGVTGIVCPAQDYEAFRLAVQTIINAPQDQVRKMRAACRDHVESHFNYFLMARRYLELYNS